MTRLSFIKANPSSVDELMSLRVKDSQQHLITNNEKWLVQTLIHSESLTFGIYHQQTAVGLVTLLDPRTTQQDTDHFQPNCLYVWRLMIDQHHQGGNFGIQALNFCKEMAQLLGLNGVTLTTMDTEKGNALEFYLSHGFQPTGRRLDGEIELQWDI